MVPVEMGESSITMAHCTEGAPSDSTGRFTMGKEWLGSMVSCHCDNRAVVDVVNNGYSRDKDIMHLLRCLFFISEHHNFLVEAIHIHTRKEEYCS